MKQPWKILQDIQIHVRMCKITILVILLFLFLAEGGQLPHCDECVSNVCVQTVSTKWNISKTNTYTNVTEAVTLQGFSKIA